CVAIATTIISASLPESAQLAAVQEPEEKIVPVADLVVPIDRTSTASLPTQAFDSLVEQLPSSISPSTWDESAPFRRDYAGHVVYPYYATRGPRDFLAKNLPSARSE